jgi:hypothetical protein
MTLRSRYGWRTFRAIVRLRAIVSWAACQSSGETSGSTRAEMISWPRFSVLKPRWSIRKDVRAAAITVLGDRRHLLRWHDPVAGEGGPKSIPGSTPTRAA